MHPGPTSGGFILIIHLAVLRLKSFSFYALKEALFPFLEPCFEVKSFEVKSNETRISERNR